MAALTDLRFTVGHEWVRREGDRLVIGFRVHAQDLLAEVLTVELPEPDDHHYEPNEDIGVVESEDMTRDFRAPVSGIIVAINTDKDAPIGEIADVLVVADLKQFVPTLTEKLKAL